MSRRSRQLVQGSTSLRNLGFPSCVLLGSLAVLAGCSHAGNGRAAIVGSVTVDGQPVSEAEIRFLPSNGLSGPAASTIVIDGLFQFTSTNGPSLGEHRVVLTFDALEFNQTRGSTLPESSPEEIHPIKPTSKSEMRVLPQPNRAEKLREQKRVLKIDNVSLETSQTVLELDFATR